MLPLILRDGDFETWTLFFVFDHSCIYVTRRWFYFVCILIYIASFCILNWFRRLVTYNNSIVSCIWSKLKVYIMYNNISSMSNVESVKFGGICFVCLFVFIGIIIASSFNFNLSLSFCFMSTSWFSSQGTIAKDSAGTLQKNAARNVSAQKLLLPHKNSSLTKSLLSEFW